MEWSVQREVFLRDVKDLNERLWPVAYWSIEREGVRRDWREKNIVLTRRSGRPMYALMEALLMMLSPGCM
jgi:hypothetical protein